MLELETKTKNPHESTWDSHGSYKWTYFAEEIKQRITFFLSQRLYGRNIDLGGGWYQSYPHSTVVDLSSVCLQYNPAQEKLQFDLDELGKSKKLPYLNHSFDSATLISVWQYLKHPQAVLAELERLLIPGGEIYIINGQGGGLEECMVRSGKSNDIRAFLQNLGYDTLIEDIPDFKGKTGEFKSVCTALPQTNIFGEVFSQVNNKSLRSKINYKICNDSSEFINAYQDYELNNILKRLLRLSTFPITQYSQDYLDRIEIFSQEYYKKTGSVPLVFTEHTTPPELLMLIPESQHFFGTMFFMGKKKEADNFNTPTDLMQKYNLSFAHHFGYFDQQTITHLLKDCKNFKPTGKDGWSRNQTEQRTYIEFISSLALNSFTKQLQKRMHEILKPNIPGLDKQIAKQKAYAYRLATFENKQRRKIDELIKIKQKIKDQEIPTTSCGNIDIANLLSLLRHFID